jgi:acetyl esterase/lipase
MTDLNYDPSAQFNVTTTDLVYLELPGMAPGATVYLPQGPGPFPGLLDIYGGAWNFGQRSGDEPMLLALASSGIVAVAIDYRKAPAHPYPAQVLDANFATRWFKARAADFNIAAESIGGMGCSSGGHTIMLNGLRPHDARYNAFPLEGGEKVDATFRYLLCCWPVSDPHARYLYARSAPDERLVASSENYFQTEAAMHEGNPQEIVERGEAQALPPMLVIQGTNDGNVPLSLPQRFEEVYRSRGGNIEVEYFPGMPHGFGNQPHPESERAIELMKGFIARQLSPTAAAV